ncbi:MAG TPA: HAD-IIIA family hydrolase [Solirubrobacteraceae bacterium]|nr:HAD-IIIA family hydrolase [Solirubrobacteraceae bacterium]
MSGRPAVFLDRDGVLNELVPSLLTGVSESPLKVDDVRLVAGAAAAVRELARAGFALVCVSNQPAAAKGEASVAQLRDVHERVIELLAREGAVLDASRLCLHHPEGSAPGLAGSCACRKPAPGMLLDAAAGLGLDLGASWMVGDTDADVAAGQAAGCRTIMLEHPGSAHKRSSAVRPDRFAADLAGAGLLLATTHE